MLRSNTLGVRIKGIKVTTLPTFRRSHPNCDFIDTLELILIFNIQEKGIKRVIVSMLEDMAFFFLYP
jgi:hypothetical protein